MFRITVIPLLAAGLLAGCASDPVGLSPNLTVVQTDTLPAPTRSDLAGAPRPYLIGPFDKLIIDVFGVEEMSKREVQTDASGRISFPLAGVVGAAGLTPGELESVIEDKLRGKYIRDPQVTVNLEETVSQVVTVEGEVEKAGLYPVLGQMTLLRAIATAGGTSEYAKLDDVIIFRQVNGQRYAGLYNLKAIRLGNYDDPEVFANDVVVVGDSTARRRMELLFQAAPLLTTPLIVLANAGVI